MLSALGYFLKFEAKASRMLTNINTVVSGNQRVSIQLLCHPYGIGTFDIIYLSIMSMHG